MPASLQYPAFAGGAYQRGQGLGAIVGSLFRNLVFPTTRRFAMPVAKKLRRALLKKGIQKSARVIEGVTQGESLGQAVRDELVPPPVKRPAQKRKVKKRVSAGGVPKLPPGKRARVENIFA